jgi:hypothetical protein
MVVRISGEYQGGAMGEGVAAGHGVHGFASHDQSAAGGQGLEAMEILRDVEEQLISQTQSALPREGGD